MERTLEFQLRPGCLTASQAWELILPWFIETYGKPTVNLNDKKIEFEAIGETLARARISLADISVKDDTLAILGDHPAAGIHRVSLFRLPNSTPPIEDLITRFPIIELIFGHESDSDYATWQVVKKPERFERAGRSHDHLAKYWDEKRQEERIDISQNPGRWAIRNGKCIDAVGSPMWIGPLFEERTGGDWRGMEDYDWCEITELDNGVVRLTSWDGPFDSDEGKQRERQEILREVLFPQPAQS